MWYVSKFVLKYTVYNFWEYVPVLFLILFLNIQIFTTDIAVLINQTCSLMLLSFLFDVMRCDFNDTLLWIYFSMIKWRTHISHKIVILIAVYQWSKYSLQTFLVWVEEWIHICIRLNRIHHDGQYGTSGNPWPVVIAIYRSYTWRPLPNSVGIKWQNMHASSVALTNSSTFHQFIALASNWSEN